MGTQQVESSSGGRNQLPVAAMFVVAAYLLCVMMVIEYLNFRSGNILPRSGHEKSRRPAIVGEWQWREWMARTTDDFTYRDKQLSVHERAQMAVDIERAKSESSLRAIVSSFGLLQYLVSAGVFLTVVVRVCLRRTLENPLAVACCVVFSLLAICMAVYRGYFSSLGM